MHETLSITTRVTFRNPKTIFSTGCTENVLCVCLACSDFVGLGLRCEKATGIDDVWFEILITKICV